MRNYSGHVVLGALAFAFGIAGTGCWGDSEEGTFPKPDAGSDAAGDADADADKPDTGGDADADADVPTCPYSLTFAAPADGAQLTEKDDADGDFCANGFQYHVTLATNAPDGTTVTLSGNAGKIADATVAAGLVRFSDVQLPSMGSEVLRADIAQTTCTSSANLSVACEGAPECAITAPVITQTHPKLNGVPVAEGGDRVSAAGSPYQVAFEVKTTVEDGQPVILKVDGNPSAVSTNAVGGVATFTGVTLAPDGDHTVVARCVPKAGIEGQSTSVTYLVDTEAPPLVAKKVRGTEQSDLQDGDHWNPEHDVDANKDGLQLRVCGGTDASDALNLPATLGAGQQNFCVAVGSSSPSCVPATTGGAGAAGDGGCVDIDCPGGGPFNLTLTMRDDAGNPTVKTTQAVTCASTLPQVQFLDPVSDGPPWSDIDKRILAASMAGQVARVDKDATTSGAQYDVVVCTNASGGTGRLMSGVQGGTMTEIGQGTVAADAANLCTGFTHVVTFADVTLTASQQATNGTLTNPTVLTAEITDESNGTGTSSIQIWVDSRAPILTPTDPIPLCGVTYQSTTPVTKDIIIGSTSLPVTLRVTSQGGTVQTYTESTFFLPDRVRFVGVEFSPGVSALEVTTTEPSGNIGTLPAAGGTCAVTVGNPPTVTWQGPLAASKLCAPGTVTANGVPDADGATAGWQGSLKACTSIDVTANPTASVQFSTNLGGALGAPVVLDSLGCATYANATLPQSPALILTARTSPIDGLDGQATITVPVDVEVPAAVGTVTATVKDRRETSFALGWTAPTDNLGISSYAIRRSRLPIVTEQDFQNAQAVPYTGTPANGGSPDGVDATGLIIENDYYFAVLPVDAAGNRPAFTATTTAARAQFKETILTPLGSDESYGWSVDGSTSINGDGYSDLIVGTNRGRNVYVYFGSATGYSQTASIVVEGPLGGCGRQVATLGDIDGDGLQDVGITCPDQTVHILRGRATWPATLTLPDDTDYLIRANPAAEPKYTNSAFGNSVIRLGDFNGDGVGDVAIGAFLYDSGRGQVIIVYGSPVGQWPAETIVPGSSNFATVDGAEANLWFGGYLAAFSSYYSPSTSALVASAHRADSFTGRAYTFSGLLPGSSSSTAGALDSMTGPVAGGYFGFPIRVVGNLGGTSSFDLGIGVTRQTGGGAAYFYFGGQGPFDGPVSSIHDSSAPTYFGLGILAGAFNGVATTVSLVGDNRPDIAVYGRNSASGPPVVYVVDGKDVLAGGDVLLAASASFNRFPLDWSRVASNSATVRDVDGDGYADLALGEASASDPYQGRVLVLW